MGIGRAVRGAAALLLVVAVAGTAGAQEAGRLVGRVTDGVGRAVEGAVVSVVPEAPTDSGGVVRTVASGETGGFGFAALPAGHYRVRVERAGFEPREQRVEVGPGERRTLLVRLRRVRGPPAR